MAVLSDADRQAIWAKYMARASGRRDDLPLLKADLRAAVDAIDGWVDANATAYNTAIPQPARGALTTKQKAELLLDVVSRRWEVSP
jgi:hypothetical protein